MKIELKQFRTVTRADQLQPGQCFVYGSRLLMLTTQPMKYTTTPSDCMLAVDLETGRHIEVNLAQPVELVNATVAEE